MPKKAAESDLKFASKKLKQEVQNQARSKCVIKSATRCENAKEIAKELILDLKKKWLRNI